MQLAIVRRRYNPYGGAERFIAQLVDALSPHGISVSILSQHWAKESASSDGVAVGLEPTGPQSPQVVPIASTGVTRTQQARAFAQGVRDILRQMPFTLVQSHERLLGADVYRLGDGVHAAWLARLEGDFARRNPWLARLGFASLRYRFDAYHQMVLDLEAQMARDPNLHYVANSQLVLDELVHHYAVSAQRITLIPNGVDTQRFAPLPPAQRTQLRAELGVLGNQPVVLFVGSGFRRKGAFELVEAMGHLPGVLAWIVGKDKEAGALERLIQRRGLSDRVSLLGPRTDVARLMQACDLFALPSLYDPSPNAVLEALACGLPVIATHDIGTMQEICAAGAGTAALRDPDDIARAIAPLTEPDHRQSFAHAARDLALRFDQREVINQWIAFYAAQAKRKQSTGVVP